MFSGSSMISCAPDRRALYAMGSLWSILEVCIIVRAGSLRHWCLPAILEVIDNNDSNINSFVASISSSTLVMPYGKIKPAENCRRIFKSVCAARTTGGAGVVIGVTDWTGVQSELLHGLVSGHHKCGHGCHRKLCCDVDQ